MPPVAMPVVHARSYLIGKHARLAAGAHGDRLPGLQAVRLAPAEHHALSASHPRWRRVSHQRTPRLASRRGRQPTQRIAAGAVEQDALIPTVSYHACSPMATRRGLVEHTDPCGHDVSPLTPRPSQRRGCAHTMLFSIVPYAVRPRGQTAHRPGHPVPVPV